MPLIVTSRTQIGTAGYTAINLPAGVTKIRAFSLHTEDGASYWVSGAADGAGGTLMPSGLPIAPNMEKALVFGSGTVTIAYVKGTTSTYAGLVVIG